MRIEDYFAQIAGTIADCPLISSGNVNYDKRSTHEGFVRAELYFLEDSVLHFREFVDVETSPERLLYSYHCIAANQGLVFRYDNTGHFKKLDLPTYPHHKHEGSEDAVVASSAPTLVQVLDEIAELIRFP